MTSPTTFENLNDFNEMKDNLLNKTVFDMFTYSVFGFASGLALSLLFKKKLRVCFVCAGVGAGISYEKNNGNMIRNLIWWQDSHYFNDKNTIKRNC